MADPGLDDIIREIRAEPLPPEAPDFLNPDVKELVLAWRNEKASPELLPYRSDLVDRLRGHIEEQLEGLRGGAVGGVYLPGLYRLDLDRVKYLLAAYLRARLGKVRLALAHS